MVQLNTTYDSSIHQKIFVLKGDEAYARTTDTIATLITDFDNYATYIERCHVGLEIQVLRELGVSKIYIYIDDEVPWEIPWSDSGMAQIIDEDWNEQGVYWENGKLIIGKYVPNSINTGLFLLYDVEHTIKVRYDGNKKCLGSSAKPIIFTVPKPDYFATTLTFNKESPRYAPDTIIDDITVTLTSDHQMTSAKTVNIYDVTTSTPVLLDTVDLEQDVATPITLEGLGDGSHKIRAVWDGDSESYATNSELNISIGYNIINLEYPSYIPHGSHGTLSCTVLDYFDEPYVGLPITVVEYVENTGWNPISQQVNADNYGVVSIDPVYYSENKFAITDGYWYSEKYSTPIINPTDLVFSITDNAEIDEGQNVELKMSCAIEDDSGMVRAEGVPITVTAVSPYGTTYTGKYYTDSQGIAYPSIQRNDVNQYKGRVRITASLDDFPQISSSTDWEIYKYWLSNSQNKTYGVPTVRYASFLVTSHGFRFYAYEEIGYILFDTDRTGIFVYEFDVVNLRGSSNHNIMDKSVQRLGISDGCHVEIRHNISSGNYSTYVNGSETYTGSTRDYGLMISPDHESGGLFLENIKIERVG